MTFPEKAELDQANPTTAFIALRWEEMFDDPTPDTFQPRLYNLESLLRELEYVAAMAERASVWKKHVEIIQAELKQSANEHKALLELMPKFAWALSDIVATSSMSEIRRRTSLALEDHPNFSSTYVVPLVVALGRMPQEKSLMDWTVSNLASFAAKSGRTKADLKLLLGENAFSLNPNELLERLCANCNQEGKVFQFIVAVNGERRAIQGAIHELPTIRLLRNDERPAAEAAIQFFEANSNSTFLIGSIPSIHVSELPASKEALKQANQMADVFNFFSNSIQIRISESILVVAADGSTNIVRLEQESRLRLAPRKNAIKLTRSTLLHHHNGNIDERLLNALELHGLSQASVVPRVRLVTLWSAIECLLGSKNEDSIIDRVVELVVPLVSWRRFQKIIKYLSISTHQYSSSYHKELPYAHGFANSDEYAVAPEDMLHMLCLPDNDPKLNGFGAFVSEHPLLLHRFHRAWLNFTKSSDLRKDSTSSQQRVEWHLYRIYRARNLTVHRGSDAPDAPALLDTLQYYFSVVLTLILDEGAKHPSWSLDTTIEFLLRKARYTDSLLQSDSGKLTTTDLLPHCRLRRDELLWPAA